ncbi:MAG: hypothetical protein AAFY63_08250 [Cyanobacteria bacterium J06643_13]
MLINGNAGNNRLIGTSGDDTLNGLGGADSLVGRAGDDSLVGGGGNDTLRGGLGEDILLGGAGNDLISFNVGGKSVDGGAGNDTVSLNFAPESDDFTLIYNSTDGGVTSDGILSGTRIEGVEQVNVRSGSGEDSINTSGASIGGTIITNNGADLIIASEGDDSIDGGSGDDTISGGNGDDSIDGGVGADIINGQDGDDVITFGGGAKTVDGGGGSDRIVLDFSNLDEDFVLTYNQFEEASPTVGGILDGTEIEEIQQVDVESGAGNDLIDIAVATVGSTLLGGAGLDSLIGGSGDDTLDGGADNDIFFGNAGSDEIIGGGGDEDVAVFAGSVDDYEITLGEETVTLEIDEDIDTLTDIDFLRFDDGDIEVATEEFFDLEQRAEREAISAAARAAAEAEAEAEAEEEAEDNEDPDADDSVEDDEDTDADADTDTNDEDADADADTDTNDEDADADADTNTDEDADAEEDAELEEDSDAETSDTVQDVDLGGLADADATDGEEGEPVFQLVNVDGSSQFYTTSETERDLILESDSSFESRGVSFLGAEAPSEGDELAGISSVSRFLNTNNDTYLYTTDDNEIAAINSNLDNFVFEGTAYYAFDSQEAGTIPVYRVYNSELDQHSFTTSVAERDSLISADFVQQGGEDGIAFYVEPATEL